MAAMRRIGLRHEAEVTGASTSWVNRKEKETHYYPYLSEPQRYCSLKEEAGLPGFPQVIVLLNSLEIVYTCYSRFTYTVRFCDKDPQFSSFFYDPPSLLSPHPVWCFGLQSKASLTVSDLTAPNKHKRSDGCHVDRENTQSSSHCLSFHPSLRSAPSPDL